MAGRGGGDFEAFLRRYRPVRVWAAPTPDRDVEAVELVFDADGSVRFVFLDAEGAESVDSFEIPVE